MSFPRYPAYKDSGVEWLGEVPEHWDVHPLKKLARLQTGMTPPTDDWDNYIEEDGFPWVRPEDLDETGAPTKASKFLTDKGWMQTRRIDKGASLICCIGTIGKVGMVAEAVSTNQQITAAQPTEDSRYLFYSICAARSELELTSTGNVLRILNTERLGNIKCPKPPVQEQTQIAAFLDHETAKIDALVAEQRRLMELLKEKRQAVISHAVTRGLNPNVPMKPSGIEWLGDVPAHWELKRLKYLGEAITGLTYSPSDIVEDELTGTLVLRSSNVQGGVITFDDNVYVSAAIPEELVTRIGDILICSRNGSRALIGKNATINEHSAGLTFGAFMTVFRSPHYAYLSCVLNSPLFEFQAGAFMTSTINQLTIGVLNNFEVPLPPERERENIAEFLAIESAKFNTLITEAQRAIDLLQERRTALISAAVTGQIDVRGAVQAL